MEEQENATSLGCTLTRETRKAHWEDTWGESPYAFASRKEWVNRVRCEETQLGYWEWAQQQEDDYLQEHQYPS